MTRPSLTSVHIGAARVRRLRLASVVAFLVMTVAAVALFFVTLEFSLRLPPSNPYSDIYLLVASAGPLAVLLHGLGVLVIWLHTDGDALNLTGRTRVLVGGLACTILALAAVLLTPLVTPPPFGGYAWITLPSLTLTLVLTAGTAAALRVGAASRVSG